MPPVTLLSPHTGRPVVVREQDLGRAIRDDQGKVFYVVEDPEHGRYAAMTRKGSSKDLERYRALQAGGAPARNGNTTAAAASNTTANPTPAYDATGVKRRNPVGIVVLLLAITLLAAGLYIVFAHPEWVGLDQTPPTEPAPPQPADTEPSQSSDGVSSHRREAVVLPVLYSSPMQHDTQQAQQPHDAPAQPDPPTNQPDDTVSDDEVSGHPRLTAAPAVLPETPDEYVDRLTQDDDAAPQASTADDPTPVIVPTRSWRPDAHRPAVLSANETDKLYADYSHTASGLRFKITHRTDGPPAKAGCVLEVRYTAQTLQGQSLIDDGSQRFVLMAGQAIRALDEGLAGIREGEQLKLFVPRGHSESGTLPGIERIPDEPFLLDVQLVRVRPGVTHIVEQPGDADAKPAMPGDTLAIHYLARVEGRDEVIATTVQDGEPLAVTLGEHAVIPGLELGLAGMRPGETRLMSIPPYLAYGEVGAAGGLIPPDAVLSFRVTLVRIVPRETGKSSP